MLLEIDLLLIFKILKIKIKLLSVITLVLSFSIFFILYLNNKINIKKYDHKNNSQLIVDYEYTYPVTEDNFWLITGHFYKSLANNHRVFGLLSYKAEMKLYENYYKFTIRTYWKTEMNMNIWNIYFSKIDELFLKNIGNEIYLFFVKNINNSSDLLKLHNFSQANYSNYFINRQLYQENLHLVLKNVEGIIEKEDDVLQYKGPQIVNPYKVKQPVWSIVLVFSFFISILIIIIIFYLIPQYRSAAVDD